MYLVDFIKEKLNIILYLVLFFLLLSGINAKLFNDFTAEGGAVSSAIIFFLLLLICHKDQFNLDLSNLLLTIAIFIFCLMNIILLMSSGEFIRIVFLYQYILILLFFLVVNFKININTRNAVDICLYIGLISVIISIYQRFDPNFIIPPEVPSRAKGLARSSLAFAAVNYSLLHLAFIYKRNLQRFFYISIFFVGIMAANSRGMIISTLFFATLLLIKNRNKVSHYLSKKEGILKYIKAFSFLIMGFYSIFYMSSIQRILSLFNLRDHSNIERINAYLTFFERFNFFGSGVGSTSPAAKHFFINSTGFESTILNHLYEQGIFVFTILLLLIAFRISQLEEIIKNKVLFYSLPIMPILLFQQSYSSPSLFCFALLSFFLIVKSKAGY
jgi:hypothetical protein